MKCANFLTGREISAQFAVVSRYNVMKIYQAREFYDRNQTNKRAAGQTPR